VNNWQFLILVFISLIGQIFCYFKVQEVKVIVNGHMTELLRLTRAQGVTEGEANEKAK